jgi:hypothetical protein
LIIISALQTPVRRKEWFPFSKQIYRVAAGLRITVD